MHNPGPFHCRQLRRPNDRRWCCCHGGFCFFLASYLCARNLLIALFYVHEDGLTHGVTGPTTLWLTTYFSVTGSLWLHLILSNLVLFDVKWPCQLTMPVSRLFAQDRRLPCDATKGLGCVWTRVEKGRIHIPPGGYFWYDTLDFSAVFVAGRN
jgi:hypothetical protein